MANNGIRTTNTPQRIELVELLGHYDVGGGALSTGRAPLAQIAAQLVILGGIDPNVLAQAATAAGVAANILAAVQNAAALARTGLPYEVVQAGTPQGSMRSAEVDRRGKQSARTERNGVTAISDLYVAGSISGPALNALARKVREVSATSATVATGEQAFTVPPNMPWPRGKRLEFTSRSSGAMMAGTVTSYQGGYLNLYVDDVEGSGTYSDWTITVGGSARPLAGLGRPQARLGTRHQIWIRSDGQGGQLQTFVRVGKAWRSTSGPEIAASDVVVSSGAALGIPAGSDATGDGTLANPVASIAKALSMVAAGGTIWLNGAPNAPIDYRGASLTIPLGVTIETIAPFGASISTTATDKIATLSPGAGASVTFGQVILDGRNATNATVAFSDAVGTYAVNLIGTRVTNWLTNALGAAGTGTRVSLALLGASLTAASAAQAVNLQSLTAGGVEVYDTTATIAQQTVTNAGVIDVKAVATGCSFSVYRSTIQGTVASTLTGNGVSYGVSVLNIAGAKIGCSSIGSEGEAGNINTCPIRVSADVTTPLDSSGFLVYGNWRVASGGKGGYVIKIGEEGGNTAATDYLNNGQVYNNNCMGTGSFAAPSGGLHGLFNGSAANTVFARNWVQNTGFALADKYGNGARYILNVVVDAYNCACAFKGSQNCDMDHNTVLQRAGIARMVQSGDNDTNGTNCVNCHFRGNVFATTVVGSQGTQMQINQDVVGTYNNYVTLGAGTWGANRFAWDLPGTLAANQQAQTGVAPKYRSSAAAYITDREPTSFSGDPYFADVANLNLAPSQPGKMTGRVPAIAGIDTDYVGRPLRPMRSAGAFALYDLQVAA